MSQLSQKILAKIHSQKIIPKSKWRFMSLHAVLWICFAITLVIGTLSVSFLLLEMNMPERLYLEWMSESGSKNILNYLPLIWTIGAILCLCLGYFVFSKTERGYRISTSWLIGALILGSSVGWFALYKSNIAEISEQWMRHFIPPYKQLRNDMRRWVPLPESGLLPWKIESITDDGYTIRSPDKKIWKVSLDCKNEECKEAQKNLKKGQPMLFMGEVKENEEEDEKDSEEFEATDIESPPKQWCREDGKKGKSCRRALLPPPPPPPPPVERSEED